MRRSNGPQEEATVRVQIPWRLNQAIIRIQAERNLTFEGAGLHVAMILEPALERYKKTVVTEATALAKSQYMTQLNRARKSIRDDAHEDGFIDGFVEGYDVCYNESLQQFSYLCKDCGQIIHASQDQEVDSAERLLVDLDSHKLPKKRIVV